MATVHWSPFFTRPKESTRLDNDGSISTIAQRADRYVWAGVRARINIENGNLRGGFVEAESTLARGKIFYFSVAAEEEIPGEPQSSACLFFFSKKQIRQDCSVAVVYLFETE